MEHANERELLRKQNELLSHATLCVMDRVFDYIYSDELLKFIKVRPTLCTTCITQ